MIPSRRLFLSSAIGTCLVMLLLVGCDLQAATTTPIATTIATANPEVASVAATSTTAGTSTPLRPTATPAPSATPAPTATPEPSAPQGGTLPIRIPAAIEALQPWDPRSRSEEYVVELLYNGLVELDDALRPQPDLAEAWTIAPDGDVITFTLRSGIAWHDGTPLTGEDVAWTLDTVRAMTATNSLVADLQSVIAEIRVPLTDTVVLSLTQPYAPLLANLAVPILPRHRLQERTPEQLAEFNFWDEPLGSGPFVFEERTEQGITFSRNAAYFSGTPNLDGVALVIAPDEIVAAQALNDEALLLAEFPPTSTVIAEGPELDEALRVDAYPENGTYFLAFNVRAERPFSDTRVREALALAVDTPNLVAEVVGSAGRPIATSLSPAAWPFSTELVAPPADLDQARALLDDAGWSLPDGETIRRRDGVSLSAQVFVRGDDPRRIAAAERIATAAEQIGMGLTIAPADFDTVILAKLAPPYDFDLVLSSWVNAPNSVGFPTNRFYDPDDYALFGADNVWNGTEDTREGLRNIGGFRNDEYEQAAKTARTTYDLEQRAEAMLAAQRVILRELPYIFLWADYIPAVISPKVGSEGGEIRLTSPRYFWDIEQWYVATSSPAQTRRVEPTATGTELLTLSPEPSATAAPTATLPVPPPTPVPTLTPPPPPTPMPTSIPPPPSATPAPPPPPTAPVVEPTPTMPALAESLVIVPSTFVYDKPSIINSVIGGIQRDDRVVVLGSNGTWYLIRISTDSSRSRIEGGQGWIVQDAVSPPSQPVPEIMP